ncbi:hypothetical protein B0O99DRAFT_687955 [Bisporella sp. PMI_857]|nr:hypothetical protein B0O99DRAFT_687955 [Bisporella sp. PMI_857]
MASLRSFPPVIHASGATAGFKVSYALPGCGEVNIIFTGLPPYQPLVAEQGFNQTLVDHTLRADAAAILKAGYNL